jgi:hypothetical protein
VIAFRALLIADALITVGVLYKFMAEFDGAKAPSTTTWLPPLCGMGAILAGAGILWANENLAGAIAVLALPGCIIFIVTLSYLWIVRGRSVR